MIHENPLIVSIQSNEVAILHQKYKKTVCLLKIKEDEATFYNGINKHILHAILAEITKYAG